jgi:hypothetical protein
VNLLPACSIDFMPKHHGALHLAHRFLSEVRGPYLKTDFAKLLKQVTEAASASGNLGWGLSEICVSPFEYCPVRPGPVPKSISDVMGSLA